MNIRPSLLGALAFSVVVALASCSARAQITPAGPAVEVLPGSGWRVLQPGNISAIPPVSRNVTATTGGLSWADGVGIPGRAGNLPAVATRVTPWAAVGAAMARCLANPVCAGVTTVSSLLWDEYRVRRDPVDGVPKRDPGVAPTGGATQQCWLRGDGVTVSSVCFPNGASEAVQEASCLAFRDAYVPTLGAYGGVRNCYITSEYPVGGSVLSIHATASVGGGNSCPASIDPTNSAYNVPAGSPVGPDGKCPTARYNHEAVTADALGQMFANRQPADVNRTIQASKDAVQNGAQIDAGPIGVSGPASQTGQSTTTTTQNPDGSTSTKTQTPTYNYTYAGDTITYNITNTVTTVNNTTGATTIETTTNAGDQADQCKLYPTSVGCQVLGQAPAAEALPRKDVPITYTPTVFAAPTGCPADVAFSMFGKPYAISWQPMCDTLATIRLLFLATGAAAAAWVFMEGLKA